MGDERLFDNHCKGAKMTKVKFVLILLSLLLVSCTSLSDMRKKDKFEERFQAYEDAVRWSDFATASTFLKSEKLEKLYPKLEELKQIKVTSYEVRKFLPSKDQSQVLLIVEIEYFRRNGLVVNRLIDQQLWKYNTTEKQWFLTSGLPDFK